MTCATATATAGVDVVKEQRGTSVRLGEGGEGGGDRAYSYTRYAIYVDLTPRIFRGCAIRCIAHTRARARA